MIGLRFINNGRMAVVHCRITEKTFVFQDKSEKEQAKEFIKSYSCFSQLKFYLKKSAKSALK